MTQKDNCVDVKKVEKKVINLSLDIDNILLARNDLKLIIFI
jgi:hypothetical protein